LKTLWWLDIKIGKAALGVPLLVLSTDCQL
jgi:hypothetical protein